MQKDFTEEGEIVKRGNERVEKGNKVFGPHQNFESVLKIFFSRMNSPKGHTGGKSLAFLSVFLSIRPNIISKFSPYNFKYFDIFYPIVSNNEYYFCFLGKKNITLI